MSALNDVGPVGPEAEHRTDCDADEAAQVKHDDVRLVEAVLGQRHERGLDDQTGPH